MAPVHRRTRSEPTDVLVTPSLRPPPPLAKRLNRNALTVAAVIMGITVLTAVVVVRPSHDPQEKPAAPAGADEAPPLPSRPAFLDEPVRASPTRPDTARGVALVPSGADGERAARARGVALHAARGHGHPGAARHGNQIGPAGRPRGAGEPRRLRLAHPAHPPDPEGGAPHRHLRQPGHGGGGAPPRRVDA